MAYPRKSGKSEKSLAEFIEWVESLEETPVDYMKAAKLLQENRKECAEWLKGKDEYWIVCEKSKGFTFAIDDMTEEDYFDFLKNHSIMMREGADDERPDKP